MSINANNVALNEILETINELPEAGSSKTEIEATVDITKNGETVITPDDENTTLSKVTVNVDVPTKEEQEKVVDITENGTTVVTPDEGMTLGGVTVNVAIESGGGGTEEIEQIIDESGVLESTDGTATEKVEQLVDRVENINQLKGISCRNNDDINHFIYDCKGLNSLEYAFYNCNKLKTITLKNTEKVLNWHLTFGGSANIISIETLDFSSADKDYISGRVGGGWIWAIHLENIKIVPQTIKTSITFGTCSKLSAESIQSIVDGLADLTGGTAQTLTLHADVKILQSQVDSANAKGWTVAGGTVVSEEEYYG